jgi:hypothetical protein
MRLDYVLLALRLLALLSVGHVADKECDLLDYKEDQ